MPLTTNEPNTHMHIPCMPKLARKSYMQPITYNYSRWSYLIQPSLSFLCLLSFILLLVLFSSLRLIPKLNWQKAPNWCSVAFLSLMPVFSLFLLYFLSILLMQTYDISSPLYLINFFFFINKCQLATFSGILCVFLYPHGLCPISKLDHQLVIVLNWLKLYQKMTW